MSVEDIGFWEGMRDAIVMGALLIALPFSAARGFTNRIYRRTHPRAHHHAV